MDNGMRLIVLTRIVLISFLFSSPAWASTVTAEFVGMDYFAEVHGYLDGDYFLNAYAGEMILDVDGVEHGAWCVDLDHILQYGPYEAELVTSPVDDVSCQLAYLSDTYYPVADDLSSAAFQVAQWKVMSQPAWLTVTEADIEAEAEALVAEAAGKCPLTCQDAAEVTVVAEAYNGPTPW